MKELEREHAAPDGRIVREWSYRRTHYYATVDDPRGHHLSVKHPLTFEDVVKIVDAGEHVPVYDDHLDPLP